jgi:hypothetical protein
MKMEGLRKATALGGLLALLVLVGCLGPGHATARLYDVNMGIENKWAREGVFLAFLPGYLVCSLGDNLIFNSIQWWTGDNPIDPPEKRTVPSEYGL